MTFDWTALGIQLSATGAVFYGTLKLFKEIEDRLHPDTKLAISVWLLDAEDKVNLCADWPTTCYSMFIQVFGKRHLTWRCFYRSILVSLVAFSLAFALDFISQLHVKDSWILLVGIGFPFAILPDYLSLWVTRLVLRLALKLNRSLKALFTLMVLDLYLSGVILSTAYFFGVLFLISFLGGNPNLRKGAASYFEALTTRDTYLQVVNAFNPKVAAALVAPRAYPLSGPYIASAICTSAWLWAYVFAGISLRTARRASFGLRWTNRIFDIESKPLQAIGLIVAFAVSALWLTGVVVSAIARR